SGDQFGRYGTCRYGQLLEFPGIRFVLGCFQADLDEYCHFPAVGAFKKQCSLCQGSRLINAQMELPASSSMPSTPPAMGTLIWREGTTVEMACLYTIWLTVFF